MRGCRHTVGSRCDPSGPRMPLTLVTGPANAAKARVVLDAARARSAASPLLVVPTFRRRRALPPRAGRRRRGARRPGRALLRAAARAGPPRRGARRAGRRRCSASASRPAAIAATPLRAPGRRGGHAGFAPALVRFAEELGESRDRAAAVRRARCAPGRPTTPAAAPTPRSSARSCSPTAARWSARAGATGPTTSPRRSTRCALEPARWGGTPVFLYGFDDLSPLQRDVVDTLANAVGAEVMLSLTFEPGRAAFAGARDAAPGAAGASAPSSSAWTPSPTTTRRPRATSLHHLERGLYEPERDARRPRRARVLALAGGGERAEVELVAAEVARLIARGDGARGDRRVVHRGLDARRGARRPGLPRLRRARSRCDRRDRRRPHGARAAAWSRWCAAR